MGDLIEEGITAVKNGNEHLAVEIFKRVVSFEPRNIDAWLWLGRAIPETEKKRECFRRVLRIDKGNLTAQNLLESLNYEKPTPSNFEQTQTIPLNEEYNTNPLSSLKKRDGNSQQAAGPLSSVTILNQIKINISPLRKCPGCGFLIAADELFCINCGRKIQTSYSDGSRTETKAKAPLDIGTETEVVKPFPSANLSDATFEVRAPIVDDPFGFIDSEADDPFGFQDLTNTGEGATNPQSSAPYVSSTEMAELIEKIGWHDGLTAQHSINSLIQIGSPAIDLLCNCLQPADSIFDRKKKEKQLHREHALQALVGIGKPSVEALLPIFFEKNRFSINSEIRKAIIEIGEPGIGILINQIKKEVPYSDRWHSIDDMLCEILHAPSLKPIIAVRNREKWAVVGLIGGCIIGAIQGGGLGAVIFGYILWSFAWAAFRGGYIAFALNLFVAPFIAWGLIKTKKAAEELREIIIGTQW
jgi:hypothetical protein